MAEIVDLQPSLSVRMAGWANAALIASLFLVALSAPLSIAATQTAWAFALLFWIVRSVFKFPRLRVTTFDVAVTLFVATSVLSSFFSYEPAVSAKKLVGVSLVSIVYLVTQTIHTSKLGRRLLAITLAAGLVAALYAAGTFIVGKNIKVDLLDANGPLTASGLKNGDTILRVNGKSVSSPEQIISAIEGDTDQIASFKVYRYEVIYDLEVPVSSLIKSEGSAERLGITSWSRGRDTRAGGFFGHYTTYSESVQLLLAVVIGLLIAVPGGFFERYRILLSVAACIFGVALFLTVTRASWAGALFSIGAMILIGTSRKVILICIIAAIPIGAVGLFYLQQKRNVGFIDTKDYSTTWRTTVWSEAVGVMASSPKHLLVGVGMDSIKIRWPEWKMFDNGNLPLGHLHSTPLQIAFERGVPALAAWIAWMMIYLMYLFKQIRRGVLDWKERGFLLGTFGGTLGFLLCGLVHYNWGDSEVVMLFYLFMGLSLAVIANNKPPEQTFIEHK